MSTISHESAPVAQEKPRWWSEFLVPEMWASLTIIVMWLAVLFSAVFGSNIVTTTAGGDRSTVPSAIVVAVFAFLATWVVAWFGFRHKPKK